MRNLFILIFIFLASTGSAQEEWETYFEKSNGLRTPRYAETLQFCRRLAESSYRVNYTVFGESPQGRAIPALIIDKEGYRTPQAIRKQGRIILMIQACIHAGESEGKDAGMMLLRDLIVHRKQLQLLNHVSIIFIPIFNPDGHERFSRYGRINQNGPVQMGWRSTAQNLNLNRDYLKADAPEMQAWLKLFTRWLPDFFVDCHTTDGADYQYAITYMVETLGNLDGNLSTMIKADFLPFVKEGMADDGYLIFPYVAFRKWHDPRSGLVLWASNTRYSTGYVASQNRPGLLIETHMLKPYKFRVASTYKMLELTLQFLDKNHKKVARLNREADKKTMSREFRASEFPIALKASMNDSVMVDFMGIDYTIERSELTGGEWFRYNGVRKVFRLPMFNKMEVEKAVRVPDYFFIPREWSAVVERLKWHGIRVKQTKRDTVLRVEAAYLMNYEWSKTPFEGRFPLEHVQALWHREVRRIPAGTYRISTHQRSARLILHALDPRAADSFLQWGFFNAIFEQKEYAESYVMEVEARKMLRDPVIKAAFEKSLIADPSLRDDPFRILDWFYHQSPWWDEKKDVYPVLRQFDYSR